MHVPDGDLRNASKLVNGGSPRAPIQELFGKEELAGLFQTTGGGHGHVLAAATVGGTSSAERIENSRPDVSP
jgi:hypothetical protein